MGRLSAQTIEHLSAYMEEIEPAYKTQVYFCFADKESGEQAYDMLKADLAAVCNYDAWSGWFGWGDKRDFYLGFTDAETRSQVIAEIKQAVAEHQAQGGKSFTNKLKGWATYLLIGTLAVAIIIVLWNRFRK